MWTGVIAIDGPAGAGKSTVARLVATKMNISYLDTGALYRAVAWYLDHNGVAPEEGESLKKALYDLTVEISGSRVLVGGEDVTSLIRTPAVDKLSSLYSALPSVREKLTSLQRDQALKGPLVADGRDMGTVIFPYAPVKIFLTASPQTRAQRRYDELAGKGVNVDYAQLLEEISRRDEADAHRAIAPLKQAADAILLDTTKLNPEQVAEAIVTLADMLS